MRLLRLPTFSPFERLRGLATAPISLGLFVVSISVWLAAAVFDGRQIGPATAWAWRPGVAVWDGDYLVLLTSALVHYDLLHLSFNLYWLLLFGVALEKALGRARFVGLSMLAAVVAATVQLAVSDSTGVGLSGVSYAWAAFAWFSADRYPELRSVLRFRDVFVLALWLGLGFALTHYGMMRLGDGAHVGGLAVGLALGLASGAGVRRIAGWAAAVLLVVASGVSLRVAPWNADWLVHQAQDAAVAHLRLGRAQYADGDFTHAVESLTHAIELDPDNGEALYFRGECRARLGEYAAAIEDFMRALRLTPDVAFVPASLGWAKINLDDDPCAALADFDRAIKLGLDDSYVRSGRANANISCGRLKEALLDFEILLAVPNPEPQNFGARCLLRFQLDDTQGAIPDCLQALAAQPSAFHRLLLGLVTLASGDQEAGFTLLRQAIESDPTQLAPRLWLYWLGANASALADVNAEGWPGALLHFARNEIDRTELLRQSHDAATPRMAAAQEGQAHVFIGLWHEHEGDSAGAIASYRAAVAQRMPRLIEDAFARYRLRTFGVNVNDEP